MIAPVRRPGVPARSLNRVVAVAVGRLGLPLPGIWLLRTRGRRTGRARATPVCVARAGGREYLVAPRGETHWARNLRADARCELVRNPARRRLVAVEVVGEERVAALTAYLRSYGWLTRRLFGVGRGAGRAEAERIAARHPVFRLEPPA